MLAELADRRWWTAMISRSLTSSLERIHERWRDRILTGLTLLMSLDLFVVAPLGAAHTAHIRPFSIGIVILLASGLVVVSRSVVPVVAIIAAVGILGASLIMQARGGHATLDQCLEATSWLLVGFVIIWVVARAVFAAGRVTYHRVIGAILLYLTIGFVFVALFTLVGALSPGSFSGLPPTDRISLPSHLVYFSFTTLTTVGFGDIVPVHPFARSLTNVEAIFGQLYPATLLARMVTLQIKSEQ
jgi:Ion channel